MPKRASVSRQSRASTEAGTAAPAAATPPRGPAAHVAVPHRTPQEAALLFWLEAASTVRASQPATATAAAPPPSSSSSSELDKNTAAAPAASPPPSPSPSPSPSPLGTDAGVTESRDAHHPRRPHSRSPPTAPPAVHRVPVADAMPLFEALVAGRLGPVAVDVRLEGHVDLLANPRLFESTLNAYDKLSAGALRTALASVQPFFLLPHAAEARVVVVGLADRDSAQGHTTAASLTVYTMDPSNDYPVLPLLAQLLRAPTVTKLLLHGRLLYRLLFLFLGTDRVDVDNVVELSVWSALGRQLRAVRTAAAQLPRDGVSEVAEVAQALPPEATRLLTEETRAFAQQLGHAAQQQQHHRQQREPRDGSTAAPATGRQSSPEADSPPPPDAEAAATRSSASAATSAYHSQSLAPDHVEAAAEAESVMDAVQLLHRVRPIGAGDASGDGAADGGREGAGHAGRKRPRTARRGSQDAAAAAAPTASAATLAEVYHALRAVTLFAAYVLPPLTESLQSETAGSRALTTRPQQQQSVASKFGAAAAAAAAAAADRRHRLSPTELCTQRTYVEFLCELMTYHGVFVSEAHTHAMMAVLEVQMTTIEDLGLRLAAAVCAGTVDTSADGDGGDGGDIGTEGGPPWTVELVHRCLRRLPVNASALSPSKIDVTHLRLLAGAAAAAAHPADAAAAAMLRLGCQLVCAWMAYQDRVGTRTWLGTRFSAVADRMHVRVLERPTEPSSSSLPRGVPATTCQVCYSTHPTWLLHNAATGRIHAAAPNVQNVAKAPSRTTFTVRDLAATRAPARSNPSDGHDADRAYDHVDVPTPADVQRWLALAETTAAVAAASPQRPLLFPEHAQWTMRHLYRAPPGCVLLSFDFNQLELRLLAHLSGDAALQRDLAQEVDVLALVTASVLRLSSAADVQPQQRQAIKVIVYGLLYGMGPKLMDERIRRLNDEFAAAAAPSTTGGVSSSSGNSGGGEATAPLSAHELLGRFYRLYPRIESYLRATRQEALRGFTVETLSGLKSLAEEPDANRRKQRGIALAVQGGAADVLHAGMVAVHRHRHRFVPYLPAAPLALIMTIHDELIYAVPRVAVHAVAGEVKRLLEDQARALRLAVPLPVSVRIGQLFGGLADYSPDQEI